MSDQQKPTETPVPCPFCGEEWEKNVGINGWFHPATDCPMGVNDHWLFDTDVLAYNKATAEMRERGTHRELALRIYNAGYHAGHHDTVEGIFSDDIHGADSEHYHGDSVSEILREDE